MEKEEREAGGGGGEGGEGGRQDVTKNKSPPLRVVGKS